ncbi:MAG: DUF4097 family beta strand repeat protein [Bacteroidales bacterium]|nr:DUF4097 family beta strand repeat protein [Candidatus Latescibacterota bacterium]
MNRSAIFLGFILILAVIVPQQVFAYKLETEWERSFDIGKDPEFILKNVNGRIEVEGWDRDEIWVMAEITIRASSRTKAERIFKKIDFEVDADRHEVFVRADLPKMNSGSFFGLLGGNRESINISYHVKVPYRTHFELESVNGRITVEDVEGIFLVKTVNGGIDLDLEGGAGDISTVNGGIDCDLKRFPIGGELNVKTVNGSVDLNLPDDTGAVLDARTMNGRVRLDFRLKDVSYRKKRKLKGVIGDGDGYINVRTTNGGIDIDRL